MKYNLLFIFSLLIFNISCEKKLEKEVNKKYMYNTISIDDRNLSIRIYDYSDSIEFITWKNINDYTTKSFKISKNDKKVLEENIYKIVTTPYENEIFCTDYVGKINISISNHNSKYSINLNSVCDWKTFNEETKNISKIIDRYK
ncbi:MULTISPECIES: hypothetical protein [Empedobacter]|uniref:hypothetical protein n=1 Tax=Empedobacter TaxID=59734 RepID=UPI0025768E39|nr:MULTISPECIES: hypothetical protein [Empedobacter]MDM1042703.1 hypothetical protein [Empedobacter brevis]MDM1136633.1 hypothetical protein [Empedobacter sp. R750]